MITWLFSGHGQAVTAAVVLIAFAGLFLSRFGSPVRWVGVALAAALLDQEIKALLLCELPPDGYYRTYLLLHGWLRIKYYHNDALGFEEPFPFLLVSTVVLAFFLLVLYHRLDQTKYRMAAATEVGGALVVGGLSGILLDRVRLGYVVDYLLIGRLIYNFADLMTIVGLATIAARVLEVGAQAHRQGLGLRDLLAARAADEAETSAPGVTVIAHRYERRLPSWVLAVVMALLGAAVLGCIWHVGGTGASGG